MKKQDKTAWILIYHNPQKLYTLVVNPMTVTLGNQKNDTTWYYFQNKGTS